VYGPFFHGGNAGSNPVGDAKSIIYRNNVYSLFSRDAASGRPAGIPRAGKWLGVVIVGKDIQAAVRQFAV
jgi:hypothetical protein